MRKTVLLSLTAVGLLAACEPMQTAEAPAEPGDACGASGFQGLIGQSRDVLAAMTFPADTRIIGPDQPVTADFRTERLNIEYDRNGRIEKISCY